MEYIDIHSQWRCLQRPVENLTIYSLLAKKTAEINSSKSRMKVLVVSRIDHLGTMNVYPILCQLLR